MLVIDFTTLLSVLPDQQLMSLVGGNVNITAPVVEDAREVEPGGVFVARVGLTSDGHNYIKQAIDKGAAAIVGERELSALPVPYARVADPQQACGLLAASYYGHPSDKLRVIGITGTDGKTTTSSLLQGIMKWATEGKCGYISTIAADLGDEITDTGDHVSTPGAPQVQKHLATMCSRGLTNCVLEMTSHGLAQHRLSGTAIDVAVITNITHEHLDYHGTWENYREAKATMFRMLSQTRRLPGQPKVSVINADDPSADFLRAIPADRVVTYGMTHKADYQAIDISHQPDGTWFYIVQKGERLPEPYRIHLVGAFNVYNALAAIAAAKEMGVSDNAIRTGLLQVQIVSGRMERIDEGQSFTTIVDFAHTPNALRQVLSTVREMVPVNKRLLLVCGSAGLRDVEKRGMMAQTAAELADVTIFTAEDPRTESLDHILREMATGAISRGGIENTSFYCVPDRGRAIFQAVSMAEAGDIVMVCGKGHEQTMCFGTVEHPWDDRDAVRAALNGGPLLTLPTAL